MYGLEILLTRSITPFIISVYIPSILIVIISWVMSLIFILLYLLYFQTSFLLPPELPWIVLLLCTSFLLLNMLNASRKATHLLFYYIII